VTRTDVILIGIFTVLAAGLGSALVTGLGFSSAGGSVTPSATVPAQGPELLAVFKANPDRTQALADLRSFGTLTGAFAGIVEVDGQAKSPRLTRQSHLAELRQVSREFRLRGAKFGDRYPALAGLLDTYIGSVIPSGKGTGAVDVDAPTRAKWVESHRVLSKAAEWAGGQL
jgi:hypothetical protein